MAELYKANFYNTTEVYQTLPQDTDFVLVDAYRPGNSIKWCTLEQMCDGTYMYPTKLGQATHLRKPTVIICSNLPPTEVYKQDNIIKYLEARFYITKL